MKTSQTNAPSKSTIASALNKNDYSALLTMKLEGLQDLRVLPKEIEKFIGTDLAEHTVLVLKRR